MSPSIKRRNFIYQSAAAASAALLAPVAKAAASERVRVGCIGASGRARSLNLICARNPQIDLVAIADVDLRNLPRTVGEVTKIQGSKPKTYQDFRKLIDDPSIDALVIGTPDHWHAIPTILGCMAGKDIYVEKPDAHDIVEGQRMIAAAKKYQRVVQVGSQHRSTYRMQSALERIREGNIGEPLVAKAWESAGVGLYACTSVCPSIFDRVSVTLHDLFVQNVEFDLPRSCRNELGKMTSQSPPKHDDLILKLTSWNAFLTGNCRPQGAFGSTLGL